MPQETLGYINLEWTCPKCATRNPGTEKTCISCGAPQPADLQFEQAQGQPLSQDESLKKAAQAGPDIHCAFCGARNPSTATECSQCGAELKEGTRRQAGKVVGAYQAGPVRKLACAACGTLNPETAARCSGCGAPLGKQPATPAATAAPAGAKPTTALWVWMAVGAVVLLCFVGGLGWVINRSMARSSLVGQVSSVAWETRVGIEALQPVTYQAWQDQVPSAAQLGSCRQEVRSVQDEQPSNAEYRKVCGTPYTLDTGSGVGQVVQDCQYEVLAAYCDYTVQEWRPVRQAVERGSDMRSFFAQPQLEQGQRLGARDADYAIVFVTPDGTQYDYSVDSQVAFERFPVGSRWTLTLNGFDQIVGVEPAE